MRAWGLAATGGMQAQVSALAEALGAKLEMKNMEVAPAFAWLPNKIFAAGLKYLVLPYLLKSGSDKVEGKPDVLISCGRRPAIVAMALRAKLGKETKFIHIQDPHVHPKNFDMVIAMQHDNIQGENVVHTEYALHSITPKKLKAAAKKHAKLFENYPKPHVAVLLGGATNKYDLTAQRMHEVLATLRVMQDSMSGSLLITVSGRTGEENIRLLKESLGSNPHVFIYDGTGDNPYLAMLEAADYLVVSNDSVNMMSEAAATQKPLYVLPLPGHQGTKPARFAQQLLQKDVARLWGNTWEDWSYEMGDETQELVDEIRVILRAEGCAGS